MLKRLWIIVRWPLAVVVVIGAMVLVTYEEHNARRKYQSDCKSHLPAPVWTFYPIDDSANECEDPKKYMPWWDVLIAWPDGIAAWGLLATLEAILWQAWETRKSVDASNRSIILQEAALRQWVNVVPSGIGIPRNLENPCKISVQFEVLNKTDYMVMIKGIEFELIPNIHDIRKFEVNCDFPLAPRKRDEESAFPFTGECMVDIGKWSDEGKIFIVAGDIKFIDCMDREQVQHFQDLYRGFIDGRLERMRPQSIKGPENEAES